MRVKVREYIYYSKKSNYNGGQGAGQAYNDQGGLGGGQYGGYNGGQGGRGSGQYSSQQGGGQMQQCPDQAQTGIPTFNRFDGMDTRP